MALEYRNGTPRYYRYLREGDTVHKIYIGSGQEALLAAERDARQRERQQAMRRELDLQNARLSQLERDAAETHQMVRQLADAVMLDTGYYRPSRHDWKKRRDD